MPSHESSRISPTAHYTSYVWYRHGLSDASLASPTGRALYLALLPMNRVWERVGRRASLEQYLLVRHRAIDELLAAAIDSGQIAQVIEIAAGFSPRGFRFARRYRDQGLTYIEGDLAPVAAQKRAKLDAAALRGPHHEVVTLDALTDGGDDSLAATVARLDAKKGTAIITEGLLGYLDRATARGVWRRIAGALGRFPRGLYLSDLYIDGELDHAPAVRAFRTLLAAFVRGRTHTQADTLALAEAALDEAGFARVKLHEKPGSWVRIVEAHTT
jgi:O-methyltransferase involved in polyketide biosynthesis